MTIPLPGDVTVSPPGFPGITVEPPAPDVGVLVPVEGPVGPHGPPGDAATSMGYVHTQISPASIVQVNHGLVFRPSAPMCIDTSGAIIDYDQVTYPTVGIMEINFGTGFAFSGTIYVS